MEFRSEGRYKKLKNIRISTTNKKKLLNFGEEGKLSLKRKNRHPEKRFGLRFVADKTSFRSKHPIRTHPYHQTAHILCHVHF